MDLGTLTAKLEALSYGQLVAAANRVELARDLSSYRKRKDQRQPNGLPWGWQTSEERVAEIRQRLGIIATPPLWHGTLWDSAIAITGRLSVPRHRILERLRHFECAEKEVVDSFTSWVVVGAARKGQRTNKLIDAERLVAKGKDLHIISETEFEQLLDDASQI